MTSTSELIFGGLKVVDCGSFIAAPAATTVLSDFGADVIKIEPIGVGDPYRNLPKIPGNPVSENDANYAWMLDSRNKRSVALDLTRADAQAVLHRLVAGADVFATNYPLPVRARLGIDHDTLGRLNERLIYASFTGYGERGAEATKPGFDVTAWWARSGMMDLCRESAATPPVRPAVGMGDHPSAISLYAAIVTALYRRERTGAGSVVRSSLVANGVWANAYLAQAALCGARTIPRPPREEAFNALTTYYRCGDDRWLILTVLNEDKQWPLLAAALGRPELATDERFATKAGRYQRSHELVAELDALFATRDRHQWRAILRDAGIVFESVASASEIPSDEQLRLNDIVVPFADGSGMTVDSPLQVEGTAKVPPGPCPDTVGQHTDGVLSEAGYDDAAIAELRAAGAIA